MHSEFVFLRQYFSNNGYPLGTVNSNIKKFLAKHFENNSDQIERNSLDQVSFFSLPFFGPKSGQMKTELNLLLVKCFPSIAFKIIVFVNYLKIGSFFHFKDRLPLASRLSVVHQFECPLCGDPYVGSTSRILSIQCSEHAGRSHGTCRRLQNEPQSNIRSHSNFSILDSSNSNVSLRIMESLCISKNNPILIKPNR